MLREWKLNLKLNLKRRPGGAPVYVQIAHGLVAEIRRGRLIAGEVLPGSREMAEELSILKGAYREQWLAENRPYWLDSILSRYDQMTSIWLTKSRAMDEALRKYELSSTLPSPEEFGLGTRPPAPAQNR